MDASLSGSSSSSPRQTRTAAASCSTSPAGRAYGRDSACVLRYAAKIPTLLLWQRHILPALSGHTHGEPPAQLPWTGRLLHGKLFVGAFNRHIHRCTPESHLCQLATLSHVMLSCPVFQAVWEWFGDVWTAVTQQPAPPLHADLRC